MLGQGEEEEAEEGQEDSGNQKTKTMNGEEGEPDRRSGLHNSEDHLFAAGEGDHGTSQADVDTWRTVKKALRTGLADRGLNIGEDEVSLVTRFVMEQLEKSGLRVVPAIPTADMHFAIKHALDDGNRMSISWVKQRTKQRWRYIAAIEAAPSWRRGYTKESQETEHLESG